MTLLRLRASFLVTYNHDDPSERRNGNSWFTFRRIKPSYDLFVTVRKVTAIELRDSGERQVCQVFMSYDKLAHAPLAMTAEDKSRCSKDVLFVGTWMPERGKFIKRLLAASIPVSIYGDRWSKAQEWAAIWHSWKAPALYGTDSVIDLSLSNGLGSSLLPRRLGSGDAAPKWARGIFHSKEYPAQLPFHLIERGLRGIGKGLLRLSPDMFIRVEFGRAKARKRDLTLGPIEKARLIYTHAPCRRIHA